MNLKTQTLSSIQAFNCQQATSVQFGCTNDSLLACSSKGKAVKLLNVARKGVKIELEMNLD